MATNILMPALSPTMEEGTLAKWLVKEGDKVSSGSVIAQIETDKATMEFEAAEDGTLGRIVVPEGTEGVKVNDVIAILLGEGEELSDVAEVSDGSSRYSASQTEPSPRDEPSSPGTRRSRPGARVFASPLARRLAAEKGLDLTGIDGSGPEGRIIRADVMAAQSPSEPAASSDISAVEPATGPSSADALKKMYADREFEEVMLDSMRRTVAARLSEAKRTIPHFYLRREVRVDALLGLRAQLNLELRRRDAKISVNDFIVKAAALGLQEVPDCNAVWTGDRILRLKPSDIAVAVAVEGGLFTPVLRDAEVKSLLTLSREIRELAARARDRRLAPHEYQGGSFAVSNLGMMGVDSFDAVINPPHASILAVGAATRRPVAGEADRIELATVLTLSLSVDHRVIDGALGARFLEAITHNLEHPLAMLA